MLFNRFLLIKNFNKSNTFIDTNKRIIFYFNGSRHKTRFDLMNNILTGSNQHFLTIFIRRLRCNKVRSTALEISFTMLYITNVNCVLPSEPAGFLDNSFLSIISAKLFASLAFFATDPVLKINSYTFK